MESQQISQSYNPPDGASILEIVNPEKEVQSLMLSFLGLSLRTKTQNNKKITYYSRDNKPTFTDEYVRNLMKDVKQFVNFTTQISRYDDERIKKHVGQYLLALKSSLCTQGDDHFISDRTWSRVLEVYNSVYEVEETDEKGNTSVATYNGWKQFGIDWDYDEPVRFEMLQFGIKNFEEEVDQVFDFKRVIRALAPFIEGSLNKSFAGKHDAMGMFISTLGEMRTETQTFTGEKGKRRGSIFKTDTDEEKSWR